LWLYLLPLGGLIALAGCARPISSESLKLVDPAVDYRQVREHPEDFHGKHLLAGGVIARISNSDRGGELEVVQFPTDSTGYPDTGALTGGRFLARSGSFLDPMVFSRGLPVTLVGEVGGEEKRNLDGVEYRYPVILIREIHLWRPGERSNPVIHFGIGIGTVF